MVPPLRRPIFTTPWRCYLLLRCTDHGAILGRWIFFVKLWVVFTWDIFTWFHDWSVGAEHLRRLQNIIKRKVRKRFERPICMKLHLKGNDVSHGALIIIIFSKNVAPKFPFGKLEWWFSICKGRISQVDFCKISHSIIFLKEFWISIPWEMLRPTFEEQIFWMDWNYQVL